MISLLLKKHPTTRPSTIAPTSRKRLASLFHLALLSAVGLSLTASHTQSAELKWGRAAQSRQLPKSASLQFQSAIAPHKTTPTHDTKVVTAAWQEDAPNNVVNVADRSILINRPRPPQYVAQLPDDPFDDIDDDLLPEIDTEEPSESSPENNSEENISEENEEQPDTEPTVDDLFSEEPADEEPADEPATDESSDDMGEDQLMDDLFGPTEVETPKEETSEPEESEQVPALNEPVDDPFDEPTLDELPMENENLQEAFDKKIEQRQDDTESMESDPLDSLNTSDLFEKEIGDNTPSDSDSEKLFDPENLNLEVGEPTDSYELTDAERQQQREQLAKERLQSEKNCEDEFAKTESDHIDDIDLSLRLDGSPGEDFPYECAIGNRQHLPRQWAQITYNWKASGLCHKPLYFEQVHLERYGHSWGPYVQPIMSGVHFFGTLPILPYKMGIRTPTECVYTLGYYRPGNCAPYMIDAVPFTWRAAIFQAGAATGLSFIFP